MITISLRQLHDETERYVGTARSGSIQIEANGEIVAVLVGPNCGKSFAEIWLEREANLARVSDVGDWESTSVISEDRDGG